MIVILELVITNDLILLPGSNKLLRSCNEAEIEMGFLSFILFFPLYSYGT